MNKLIFGSYFSGGGLADVGAMMAGFAPVFGVEGDPGNWGQSMRIADAYEANVGRHLLRQAVQDVDVSSLPKVDWFHASPVCKSFSVANQQAGEKDVDRITAQATADYIIAHRPRAVTVENVWGYRHAPSWHIIAQALTKNGYGWRVDHINMADYGVPQTRKRMIVTAVLNGNRLGLLPQTHEKEPVPSLFGHGLPRWVSWYEAIQDLIPTLPDTEFAPWQLRKLAQNQEQVFLMTNQNDAPTGAPNRGARLYKPNVPIGTILADSATRTRVCVHGSVIKLTPRAFARLQTLPDWYNLPPNDRDAVALLGNGVPCLFVQKMGQFLKEVLE
jgi:DNA (cytosine-5)-methyltransferase 1